VVLLSIRLSVTLYIVALRVGHRRTSQGAGGGLPPDSGKAIIFRAKAKFFGHKPTAKMKKNIFVYLLNEKNGIHSV